MTNIPFSCLFKKLDHRTKRRKSLGLANQIFLLNLFWVTTLTPRNLLHWIRDLQISAARIFAYSKILLWQQQTLRLANLLSLESFPIQSYFFKKPTSLNSATCFCENIEKTLEPVRLAALRLPREDCRSLPPVAAGAAGAGAASSAGASSFTFFFFTFSFLSAWKRRMLLLELRTSFELRVVWFLINYFADLYST